MTTGKINSYRILIYMLSNFIHLASLIIISLSKDDNVNAILLLFYVIYVSAVFRVLIRNVLNWIRFLLLIILTIIYSALNFALLFILIAIII